MSSCYLCLSQAGLTVRLKPRTDGVGILGVDGGGPEGIIPLEHLEIL
jgi:hypothetical protein